MSWSGGRGYLEEEGGLVDIRDLPGEGDGQDAGCEDNVKGDGNLQCSELQLSLENMTHD